MCVTLIETSTELDISEGYTYNRLIAASCWSIGESSVDR